MIPRPRFRLPLWAVPVIVAALYVARSLVRNSWRPELPTDLLVLALVVFVMIMVARLRIIAATPSDEELEDERGASRVDAEGPTD